MPNQIDIEKVKDIPDIRISEPIVPEGEMKLIDSDGKSISVIAFAHESFWNKPLGRTIKGKNKTGKIIYGVLTIGISLLTGINIQPLTKTITEPNMIDFFTDINFWAIISFLFGLAATYLKTKTGAKLDAIIDDADTGLELYAQFKAKDSEKGEKISEGEQKQLIEFFAGQFAAQKRKAK